MSFRIVSHGLSLALGAWAVLAAPGARAAADETSVTIYSTAQPGGIAPELYRPLPGQSAPGGSVS
jgi:hypothetical protein